MKKNTKVVLIFLCVLAFSCRARTLGTRAKAEILLKEIGDGTADKEFSEKYFSKAQTALLMNQLRNYCDFKNRKGNFINDFYQKNVGGEDRVSYLYEFYLKCDSIRVIVTYKLGASPELMAFALESVRKDNPMILKPKRRLHH